MGTKEKIKAIINIIICKLVINFTGIVAEDLLSPGKSEWLKYSIGCVIGMMMLGSYFPNALKNISKLIDEMIGK